MKIDELYTQITAIFCDLFMRDDLILTPEMTANDIAGWDSFRQVEILLAIEEHFRVKFHTRELDQLQNVGDLVRAVAAKLAI